MSETKDAIKHSWRYVFTDGTEVRSVDRLPGSEFTDLATKHGSAFVCCLEGKEKELEDEEGLAEFLNNVIHLGKK